MFDTVCIVGVGLIGGSFGMALRERKLARQVIGAVRREETIHAAAQKGAVDNATTDLTAAARGADLVFMAPPVGQMKALCDQLAEVVKPDTIVTDGGSTKADIVRECTESLGGKAIFVGGHPMAGSDRSGVEHARGDLFEGAIWVLTPTPGAPPPVVNQLVETVEAVGALPLLIDAETHDSLLAVTSHMPHITAAALVHQFIAARDRSEVAQQLIASGWRDSTRVAGGSSEMWRDICLANSAALTVSLDEMIEQLTNLRAMLEEKNGDRLYEWFEQAGTVRRKHGYFPRKAQ